MGEDEYFSDKLNSPDPDDSGDEKRPKFERFKKEHLNKDYKFKWGMEFNSLVDFKDAIREWSMVNGREITFVKNESYRVRVECKAKCGFLVLCSKVGHKHTFAIKTLKDTHTCARILNNRSAKSKWVAKHVVKMLQTSETVRISDIIQEIRQKISIGISVARDWKAKMIAKKVIEGDADSQYAFIWRYAAEITRVNPDNTVKINVERPSPSIQPRFGSFYFYFDGCKKGFIHGCRPFVGVDGCHLKTKYGGQLLIVVVRDANDQYFLLAFSVVETETRESWRWFLQLLMEDIGQDRRYVFISDQQKGLVAVFDEMFDRIEHRLCLRHLYANFKKRFGGGTLIRDLIMGAAKATYYQAWVQKMDELKKVDTNAWSWLMAIVRSELVVLRLTMARDKPILTMCEWIRKYLMNRLATSATKLEKWQHRVMPIPRKRLDTEVFNSGHWLLTWSMDEKFQVTHSFNTQEFILDITKRTCSCNFWEQVGIPCRHDVAVLSYRKQNPDDFVDECYTREKFKLYYGFSVSPINGQDMWPKVEVEKPLPPAYKIGPGRPRKLRIRESWEDGARKRRPGVAYKCTKCDKFGHNVMTCKSKTQDPDALKRKRKVKSDASGTAANTATETAEPDSETVNANTVTESSCVADDANIQTASPDCETTVPGDANTEPTVEPDQLPIVQS
ncbi:uncharacterized protein LOC131614317 [Vicia villosa]|uniref:uncharacterized protein LOC131614317 n=1 Tax=Vicia villosa TaxID=3911 RepID=UPI00273AB8E8|nr:uncharacterized protein LOC131614317 [Vicia villosa]